MSENLWHHRPSNTTWALVGEDVDANNNVCAVMEPRSAPGILVIVDAFSARMRIDPKDLVKVDSDWELAN